MRARVNAAGSRPQLSRSLAPKVGVRTAYGDEGGIGRPRADQGRHLEVRRRRDVEEIH